jgi:hypothetical protein
MPVEGYRKHLPSKRFYYLWHPRPMMKETTYFFKLQEPPFPHADGLFSRGNTLSIPLDNLTGHNSVTLSKKIHIRS